MSSFDRRLRSPLSRKVRIDCPECRGGFAILRVIAGRVGSEYWIMRCTRCGDIHLDIINPRVKLAEHEGAPRIGGTYRARLADIC